VNKDLGCEETRQTDSAGNIMLVGAEESINRYALTVAKSGYETVNTYIPYPDTEFKPVDIHTSVIAGMLNTTNIIQNKTANIKISTKDYLGSPVADIDFSLSGGRKIGTIAEAPYSPVYNFNETGKTDSNGEKEFNSVSPGQYNFGLDALESEYTLIGINPISPFSLVPEDNLEIAVKLVPKNITSLSVKVKNASGEAPISGAQVKLSNAVYDKTVETGSDGMAFFPTEASPPFEAGTYNLEITADGFQSYANSGILISAGELKTETILLNPNE
jgi:hypothetical protein